MKRQWEYDESKLPSQPPNKNLPKPKAEAVRKPRRAPPQQTGIDLLRAIDKARDLHARVKKVEAKAEDTRRAEYADLAEQYRLRGDYVTADMYARKAKLSWKRWRG
jgi:hypothetical protein